MARPAVTGSPARPPAGAFGARPVLIAVAVAAGAVSAWANTILTEGTPGEPAPAGDARSLAMGGAVLAGSDGANLYTLNPAVAASLSGAAFNLTTVRGYSSYRTAQGKSVSIDYDVPGVSLCVPAGPHLALDVGLRERINQNYQVTAPIEYEGEVIGLSEERGVGSVYSFRAGAAWPFGERWLAGAAVAYDFGAPSVVSSKFYREKGFKNGEEKLETSYKGVALTIGGIYKVDDRLSLGACADYPFPHKVHEELLTDLATLHAWNRTYDLPLTAGVGASYVFGPRAQGALDLRYTRWSAFKVDGAGFDFRDTVEVRGGVEGRINAGPKGFFLWRMPYRAGAFYAPWYALNHGRFTSYGFTGGAGYLFHSNQDSRIDAALEYVRRGSPAQGFEESQYNFYLSVVGLEAWFTPKEETLNEP